MCIGKVARRTGWRAARYTMSVNCEREEARRRGAGEQMVLTPVAVEHAGSMIGGEPMSPGVLYEDERLLAVAKPAGMVTHPAYRHPDGTLADAVFARQAARGEGRPWLLHRLDRETSGVVLFAKTMEARRALVRQFERRTVGKRYIALLADGPAADEGVIEAPLGAIHPTGGG